MTKVANNFEYPRVSEFLNDTKIFGGIHFFSKKTSKNFVYMKTISNFAPLKPRVIFLTSLGVAVFFAANSVNAENNGLSNFNGCYTERSVITLGEMKKGSLSLYTYFNKHFSFMPRVMNNVAAAKHSTRTTQTAQKRTTNGDAVTVPQAHTGFVKLTPITLSGENLTNVFKGNLVKIFLFVCSKESDRVADNSYTDAVKPYSDTVIDARFVPLQFAQFWYILDCTGLPDCQNSLLDICNDRFDNNPFDVPFKAIREADVHLFLKDFITCSKLVKPDLSDSSICEMAYSSPSLRASARLKGLFSGFVSRFGIYDEVRGVMTDVLSMRDKFLCDAAKLKNISKKIGKTLGNSKTFCIFVPEIVTKHISGEYAAGVFYYLSGKDTSRSNLRSCCTHVTVAWSQNRDERLFLLKSNQFFRNK